MKKVLVVEDEITNLALVKIYLDRLGFKNIISTCSGKDAIKLFKNNKEEISFILMDVRLIDLNGYIVTKEVLKIKYVPVIMVTAQTMENSINGSFEAGCIDHINKPYSIEKLEEVLKTHKLI